MKILHISFHKGCQNDIEYVCKELHQELNFMEFDDGKTRTCAKYNIGHDRANDCWNKYKDYFNKFDIIITSDTAPISRVFLQNYFEKRLIIWVCNRFDYYDAASLDCKFPDQEYYDLIKSVKNRKNVTIMGYTPFENYYAKNIRNVDIGELVIKPIGKVSDTYSNFIETKIENKQNTFFVPPYHNDTIMMNLSKKLTEIGILNYNSRYNGPLDLLNFKGVIHIPYAWSNLAFFEAIQLGIVYFIPSKNFLFDLTKDKDFFWSPPFKSNVLELSEWYNPEHKNILVYFDSWDDLLNKTKNIDYNYIRLNMKQFTINHTNKYIDEWKKLFGLCI